jgi:hypothetical protein
LVCSQDTGSNRNYYAIDAIATGPLRSDVRLAVVGANGCVCSASLIGLALLPFPALSLGRVVRAHIRHALNRVVWVVHNAFAASELCPRPADADQALPHCRPRAAR